MELHEQSFSVPLTDAPVGFGPGGISTAVDQREAKKGGPKAALIACADPTILGRARRAYGTCPRPGRHMTTKFAASRLLAIRSATIDAITSARQRSPSGPLAVNYLLPHFFAHGA
jgi:hypothetical protein